MNAPKLEVVIGQDSSSKMFSTEFNSFGIHFRFGMSWEAIKIVIISLVYTFTLIANGVLPFSAQYWISLVGFLLVVSVLFVFDRQFYNRI